MRRKKGRSRRGKGKRGYSKKRKRITNYKNTRGGIRL